MNPFQLSRCVALSRIDSVRSRWHATSGRVFRRTRLNGARPASPRLRRPRRKDALQSFRERGRSPSTFVLLAIIGIDSSLAVKQAAAATELEAALWFDAKVAPILSRHCIECHDSTTRKGKLDLSRKSAAFAGGKDGKVIVPGRAEDSPLWQAVAADEMPDDRPPLSAEEKDILRQWINAGAAWPGEEIDPLAHARKGGVAQNWIRRLTIPEYVDRLEAKGLTRDTLIVYVGDNGWIQKEDSTGFTMRSKQSPNEGGVRQPTMFCWPGVIQPGNRGEQLCSSVDIVPTALAAAGATIPKTLPGHNLLPILKTGRPTPRDIVFGESFSHDVANIERPEDSLLYRWAIEGKWKLLLTYDGELGPRYHDIHPRTERRPQLFDLTADPHEDKNLATQNPAVVARLAAKLQQWWPVNDRQAVTTWRE